MTKELVSGKPQRSEERIELLLRKTHQVGKIVINIPTIFSLGLIQKLDHSNLLDFTCEALFILHHQHNEDLLFSRGDDRERAKLRLLSHIPATKLPDYYVAIMETLEATEKKSARSSQALLNQTQQLISQLHSSPSPTNPDNPSDTSPTT